ncbi:hypothetical protein BU14_2481s0001 [Porphyra umbilicalis]|uniref:Uncharacterized protein n=1 Tax=Porphyra umbilicalis TaxID=2786 RepID=A0A1X6NJ41_PORUM|nr:hypothetical protein BU14_2481s0001 [Porphyra umbilicalis]|eukprot:OSX68625.1 hypothetical protein BU14_2481s0001 [Porphyra umbilicalis]
MTPLPAVGLHADASAAPAPASEIPHLAPHRGAADGGATSTTAAKAAAHLVNTTHTA